MRYVCTPLLLDLLGLAESESALLIVSLNVDLEMHLAGAQLFDP